MWPQPHTCLRWIWRRFTSFSGTRSYSYDTSGGRALNGPELLQPGQIAGVGCSTSSAGRPMRPTARIPIGVNTSPQACFTRTLSLKLLVPAEGAS